MNRSLAQLALAATIASLLAACGGAADSTAPKPFSVARGGGGLGPLVGFRGENVSFRLPAGIASADGRFFYVASAGTSSTDVQRYDRRTGTLIARRAIDGSWTLGGVSATGRFVALAAPGTARSKILVVDTSSGRRQLITLRGRYDAEAVSPDGRAVYLIRWHGTSAYSVKYYDLARSQLRPATLSMKGQYVAPVMTGSPAGSIATSDGRWLLTLYLNTKQGRAFVHALNLVDRNAVCIVLPGEGSGLSALRSYALAASPDGKIAYAANPALGVIAEVDLEGFGVEATIDMPKSRASATASALSESGRMLYVAAGSRLWAYDTEYLALRGPYEAHSPVTALAFNGKTVFAVRGDGTALPFGAATGKELEA
jgi:DNA-binding beta-propeller fold protein YncE